MSYWLNGSSKRFWDEASLLRATKKSQRNHMIEALQVLPPLSGETTPVAMPFARVGAMPPPSRTDAQSSAQQDGGRARSNRQKGITMEDLKKQTAIRLAQEQHHSQAFPGTSQTAAATTADPRTRHPVVTPQTLAARRAPSAVYGIAPSGIADAAPSHYQRLHHNSPVVHHIPKTGEPAYGARPYFDHSQGGKNPRSRNGRPKRSGATPGPSHAPSVPLQSIGTYQADERSQYLRSSSAPVLPTNPLSSNVSAYNTASSNQDGQSSSTSKLPHGLTVHELKEMTKARLQAEAAEKMSNPSDRALSVSQVSARESASFEGTQANFPQLSNTSGYDPSTHGNEPHLVPAQVQTQPKHTDHRGISRQPAQVSPPSPAFHNFGAAGSTFNETIAQDHARASGNRNRVDSYPDSNWECASVTSHNSTVASDYMGSESAYSSGVGGFPPATDDRTGMSLGRTQSYPIGGGHSAGGADVPSGETTPNSVPSPLAASYFDPSTSGGQNRQRSLTLSPRPGLSLLHEDRPGFSDEDDLGIPSFAHSRFVRQQLAARSRSSFSPILQPPGFGSESFHSSGSGNSAGIIGDGSYENRPRTSSAVSLPAISHTAEEFALDINGQNSRRSSDGANVGGAPIRGNMYNPLPETEGVLGSSSLYGSTGIGSLTSSGVFRDDVSGDYGNIPAPPGLGHGSYHAAMQTRNPTPSRMGDMESLGNNRVRAATWVAGEMFGSAGSSLYSQTSDDNLAGDLASILKLSGAEESVSSLFGGDGDVKRNV